MINLTPHSIIVRMNNGNEVVFSPSGKIARLTTDSHQVMEYDTLIGEIPVVETIVCGSENIPDPMSNVKFLVSSMVLDSLGSEYHGLAFAPDTGPTAIRNEEGHIVAVTRFRTVKKDYEHSEF